MRIPPLITVFLVLAGAASGGTMCVTATLLDYVNLAPDNGCTINGSRLMNFELAPLLPGATEIDPSAIQVTPGGGPFPQLILTLNSTAGPGQIFESFFRFNVVGGGMMGASISLGNASTAGDGAITGVLDACSGGPLSGDRTAWMRNRQFRYGNCACDGLRQFSPKFGIASPFELLRYVC
jgi:hypothetical protein